LEEVPIGRAKQKWEFVVKVYGDGEFAPAKFIPFNNGSLGDFKK
jgi:hypothetical protein